MIECLKPQDGLGQPLDLVRWQQRQRLHEDVTPTQGQRPCTRDGRLDRGFSF
jgi:hypothetical protein